MSWWDKYFAPGDIRHSQSTPSSVPSPPSSPSSSPTASNPTKAEEDTTSPSAQKSPLAPRFTERASSSTRQLRQDALLYGGLAFTLLSALVTRRSLARKHIAAYPQMIKTPIPSPSGTGTAKTQLSLPTFTPSNIPPKVEGGLDAAEALGLATLSVFSVFMAGTGLFMKWNNIGDVEDLRDWVRAGVGYDVYGGETEADKEIEAWMAEVLARKDGVGDLKTSVLEKMQELAEIDKKKYQAEKEARDVGAGTREKK